MHAFPGAEYITFDDALQVAGAEGSPAEFVSRLRGSSDGLTILDEVQYVPGLLRQLKLVIDRERRPGRFLLTGSQHFRLLADTSESLAGRMGFFDLGPLAASEILPLRPMARTDELLLKGGWPELWARNLDAPDWFPSYIRSYLQRDLSQLVTVGDLATFGKFLRALALRTGSLLSYADLSRDVGAAPNTVKRWVSLLESTGIVALCEGWFPNASSRLVKAPKAYFTDSGLLCSLLGYRDEVAVRESPLRGAIWETWCRAQLAAWLSNRNRSVGISCWRTKEGREVDFLVEDNGVMYAFECKTATNPSSNDARNLKALRECLKKLRPDLQYVPAILCPVPEFIPLAAGLDVALGNGSHLSDIFRK